MAKAIGTQRKNVAVRVQPDLSSFLRDMSDWNGLPIQGYANDLIERGIRQDLLETGYTADSVTKFLNDLKINKRCDWNLLVPKDS